LYEVMEEILGQLKEFAVIPVDKKGTDQNPLLH
jgi:hypothetical protein